MAADLDEGLQHILESLNIAKETNDLPSGPEQPAERDTASTTTAAEPRPSFLAMPKELRLQVYDELLEPLIRRPEHFDTYVLPSEWPKNDLTPYTSLLFTSRQICEEVKDYFESRYLPKIFVLYLDNLNDLYALKQKLAATAEPSKYGALQICLRSGSCTFDKGKVNLGWGRKRKKQSQLLDRLQDMRVNTRTFMMTQPGFDPVCLHALRGLCSRDLGGHIAKWVKAESLVAKLVTQSTRDGKTIDTLQVAKRGGRARPSVKISVHQVCLHVESSYSVMTAAMKDLYWDELLESVEAGCSPDWAHAILEKNKGRLQVMSVNYERNVSVGMEDRS
ncbi:hypothetical protein LTR85_009571 [Meristemomyces frigidus]|nr:hypothetical protein LTR85_009571 [Meristemomyces frigidus]